MQPGEELTYDYMFEHYGLSKGVAQGFRCMCGAANCRCDMEIIGGLVGARLNGFSPGSRVFLEGKRLPVS